MWPFKPKQLVADVKPGLNRIPSRGPIADERWWEIMSKPDGTEGIFEGTSLSQFASMHLDARAPDQVVICIYGIAPNGEMADYPIAVSMPPGQTERIIDWLVATTGWKPEKKRKSA